MNLADFLRRQALERPHAAAIVDRRRGRRRISTFADVDAQAARAAALLFKAGLRPGDAVLVLYPMSAELYVALAALFRLGLVAVVVDPGAGLDHVADCCRRHPIRGFIGSSKAHALRLLVSEIRSIPIRFVVGGAVPGARRWAAAAHEKPLDLIAPCALDTPALLTFTSGSTGTPKAVMRTHGLLVAQYQALRRSLRLEPGQVDLATLPVFALANLAAGVTSVIPDADLRRPGAIDSGPILAQMRRERITRIGASPAFFERLLLTSSPDAWQTVQQVYTGGAPVFPGLMLRLHQAAPSCDVLAVYGSTEAEPIAHVGWHDITPHSLTKMQNGGGLLAGVPVPEVDLRILPDQWGVPRAPMTQALLETTTLPPGHAGEIVVTGRHVLSGYLGEVGEAETKFDVDGVRWHRTGDAGYLDEEGHLWLLGRCSAKVETPTGTTYPFAVEVAAQSTPNVRRAAFVAHRGRRLLVVEPHSGAAPDVSLLRHEAVDTVHVVDRLPVDRRHNAKIDYGALRRLLDGERL